MQIARALAIIMAVCLIGACQGREKTDKTDILAKCKKLQIGMTEMEVIRIMGPAIKTVSYEVDEVRKKSLIFSSPGIRSQGVEVMIDEESGLAESIFCGEDYMVKDKRR